MVRDEGIDSLEIGFVMKKYEIHKTLIILSETLLMSTLGNAVKGMIA
jgi:hypothetical protein